MLIGWRELDQDEKVQTAPHMETKQIVLHISITMELTPL